jgi:uncharacterized Fe-S center protein
MHCHGETALRWDSERCTLCQQCAETCPLDSIEFKEGTFTYDEETCWHCGRCARVCQESALSLPQDDETFMKSMAESAAAVLSTFKDRKKVLYVNVLLQVQPECDCMPIADVPVIQDQGILVSDDLVAIEQASVDILRKAPPLPQSAAEDAKIPAGADILGTLNPRPLQLQIDECERLGLGSKKYELVTVEP